jgi:hypothetical protein
MGYSTEAWFNDAQAVGTGGIINPERDHLKLGQQYYRFASSSTPYRAQVGGGWWIDYEQFIMIRDHARRYGHELGYAARLFLALPYEWTRVDRLWSAFLKLPLDAYTGYGRTAQGSGKDKRDAGTRWTPMQHKKAIQLYIPGLVSTRTNPDRRTEDLYESAFSKPEWTYVATA